MCDYVFDIFTHCSCGKDEVEIQTINPQQQQKHFEKIKKKCNKFPHRVKAIGVTCLSRVVYISIKHTCPQEIKTLDIDSDNCILTEQPGNGRYGYNCYETKHLKEQYQHYQLPKKF
uniref:SUEL-type lectin domain-containing protein n=1 Tax=Strongyloides papillosus TaxID=174720 RepID=A0A0N5BD32_STREA